MRNVLSKERRNIEKFWRSSFHFNEMPHKKGFPDPRKSVSIEFLRCDRSFLTSHRSGEEKLPRLPANSWGSTDTSKERQLPVLIADSRASFDGTLNTSAFFFISECFNPRLWSDKSRFLQRHGGLWIQRNTVWRRWKWRHWNARLSNHLSRDHTCNILINKNFEPSCRSEKLPVNVLIVLWSMQTTFFSYESVLFRERRQKCQILNFKRSSTMSFFRSRTELDETQEV